MHVGGLICILAINVSFALVSFLKPFEKSPVNFKTKASSVEVRRVSEDHTTIINTTIKTTTQPSLPSSTSSPRQKLKLYEAIFLKTNNTLWKCSDISVRFIVASSKSMKAKGVKSVLFSANGSS